MKRFHNLYVVRVATLAGMLLLVATCMAAPQLTINIEGLENNEGFARIVLFDSQDGYKGTVPPFLIESVPISANRAVWTVNDIPTGNYVAIVHHDRNANNELDRPFFSLPLERYGYSNNAFKTMGLPDYQEVEFILDDGLVTQNISTRLNPIALIILSVLPYRNLIVLTLALVLPLLVCFPMRRWIGPWASDARLLGRVGITLFLLMASSAHFTEANRMMLMLPPWIPGRILIIYFTGGLEIVLSFALWVPGRTYKVGAMIALILLIFLPANIYSAINSLPFGGNEIGPRYLFVRIPYQILLILWVVWATGLIKSNRPRQTVSSTN